MQRLTARLLLLFALAGTFAPVALQALAASPHACCLRKSAHRCHTTGAQDPVVRSADCCNHDCSHAVVTSQWAHPESLLNSATAQGVTNSEFPARELTPAEEFLALHSGRAPPQSSLA